MRIQVTNDDGIDSIGLHVLVRHLVGTGHEIVVAAPDRDWSGASAALGSFRPDRHLPVERRVIDGAPDVEAWAIDGPPALTVIAAQLGAFGPAPDLIVSGINAGLNTGRSVLHSGTVGAALTGQNFGRSGLAVSAADSDPWYWDTAAEIAVEVLPLLLAGPPRSVLNLNVPALDRDQVMGIRWTALAPFGAVRTSMSGAAEGKLQVELIATDHRPDPDTDQGAANEGYATLTALAGVTEAWGEHVVPGDVLQEFHSVPDASAPNTLRRARLGEPVA